MGNAFEFTEHNEGLTIEASYPYKGVDGTCHTNVEANYVAKINIHEDVPTDSGRGIAKSCG